MPLGLSFRLRTTRTRGEAMLFVRLYFDGIRLDDYASGIKVPVEIWPDLDPSHPQSKTIALRLAKLRAEHDRLLLDMELSGERPTAQAIKSAWLSRDVPKEKFTLIMAMTEYIDYLTPLRKKNTMVNYALTLRHLRAFLLTIKRSDLPAEGLKASFGYSFYDYLIKRMSPGTAKTYVSLLSAALRYALRFDKVTENKLYNLRLAGDPPKPIYFLTELQLIELACLPLKGTADDARSWALLMCYTGLDYHDALEVISNLGSYYRTGPHGETIVYQRLKGKRATAWGECEIPILPEVRSLLTTALDWKRPKLRNLNDYLDIFGKEMNLPFRFSSKVCRKTGGAVMLLRYKKIHVVQKVLGHKSVTMTEKSYVSILPKLVHEAMIEHKY